MSVESDKAEFRLDFLEVSRVPTRSGFPGWVRIFQARESNRMVILRKEKIHTVGSRPKPVWVGSTFRYFFPRMISFFFRPTSGSLGKRKRRGGNETAKKMILLFRPKGPESRGGLSGVDGRWGPSRNGWFGGCSERGAASAGARRSGKRLGEGDCPVRSLKRLTSQELSPNSWPDRGLQSAAISTGHPRGRHTCSSQSRQIRSGFPSAWVRCLSAVSRIGTRVTRCFSVSLSRTASIAFARAERTLSARRRPDRVRRISTDRASASLWLRLTSLSDSRRSIRRTAPECVRSSVARSTWMLLPG